MNPSKLAQTLVSLNKPLSKFRGTAPRSCACTVAILAQGTSWAVASSQASLITGPSSNPPTDPYIVAW